MANMPTPKQNMTRLAPVTERTRNRRSGTSGWEAARASTSTKVSRRRAEVASTTRVDVAVHDTTSVWEMAYTSRKSAPVMVAAPATSSRRRGPSARDSCRRTRATANRAIPIGTLTKRIQRHDRYWVSSPPNRAPAAPPPAATALHTPNALARARWSVNVTVRMVSVAGDRMAAPTPWSERAAIRVAWSVANPPSRLAAVKRPSPTRKMRRRPYRSASRPPSSSSPPKVRA